MLQVGRLTAPLGRQSRAQESAPLLGFWELGHSCTELMEGPVPPELAWSPLWSRVKLESAAGEQRRGTS